ncbi:MAG TPA: T9SS type A sorting domain-containing protein [Puia sp.]|nr:T9SS type A sorting domain-containing protein [Puia sp.]
MKTAARLAVSLILIALQHCIANGQTLSGTVNSYYAITAVNSLSNVVTVDNAAGLSVGQRVLLYQAKGAAINAANSSAYGDLSSLNNAGGYELNTICSITGNDVWMLYHMVNAYNPTGQPQLVTVPSNATLTVTGTVTALPWDPATGKGGIVALEATGTLNLNADIDVSSQGFQGGALVNYATPTYNCEWYETVSDYFYGLPASGDFTGAKKGEGIAAYIVNEEYGRGKLANGGGGGDGYETGGGGGGNYGAGGDGGQRAGESFLQCHGPNPGIGGSSLAGSGYSVATNRIFFGGGGGSGWENDGVSTPGGNGGGIILLSAPTLNGGGGRLLANGQQSTNPINLDPYQAEGDGGGGGGAGGTIVLNAATITGAITAQAMGAKGSDASNRVNDCDGPGGGGGGGMIWTAGSSFPAAVGATVTAGANGIVSLGNSKLACRGLSNGATSGLAGLSQDGYALPLSSGPVCTILATSVLQYFNATRSDQDVLLSWGLVSPDAAGDMENFVIQRSTGLSPFSTLATVPAIANISGYRYTDAAANVEGTLAYRLAWQNKAGEWSYSRIVAVSGRPGPDAGSIRLYPNPATGQLNLTLTSATAGMATVTIANALGQPLLTQSVFLQHGMNTISIPLETLAPAAYFFVLESAGRRVVRPFLKKDSRE